MDFSVFDVPETIRVHETYACTACGETSHYVTSMPPDMDGHLSLRTGVWCEGVQKRLARIFVPKESHLWDG